MLLLHGHPSPVAAAAAPSPELEAVGPAALLPVRPLGRGPLPPPARAAPGPPPLAALVGGVDCLSEAFLPCGLRTEDIYLGELIKIKEKLYSQ